VERSVGGWRGGGGGGGLRRVARFSVRTGISDATGCSKASQMQPVAPSSQLALHPQGGCCASWQASDVCRLVESSRYATALAVAVLAATCVPAGLGLSLPLSLSLVCRGAEPLVGVPRECEYLVASANPSMYWDMNAAGGLTKDPR